MIFQYNFSNNQIQMGDTLGEGFTEIPAEAFNAFFEMQSKNAGSGLYFRDPKNLTLVRRNGDETTAIDKIPDVVWSKGGYVPTRPSFAHVWDGKAWIENEVARETLLRETKDLLKSAIDAKAVEVGDNPTKSSIYFYVEYQQNAQEARAWRDAKFAGEPPLSVQTGASSHGIEPKQEALNIISENEIVAQQLELLRSWRMEAKGLAGIEGAKTVQEAHAIFDSAMQKLNAYFGG